MNNLTELFVPTFFLFFEPSHKKQNMSDFDVDDETGGKSSTTAEIRSSWIFSERERERKRKRERGEERVKRMERKRSHTKRRPNERETDGKGQKDD